MVGEGNERGGANGVNVERVVEIPGVGPGGVRVQVATCSSAQVGPP